jgi:hypothetical protein
LLRLHHLPIAREDHNVNDQPISGRQQKLSAALEQLRSALRLLDGAAAPSEIGAHIDLAAHQLELTIEQHLTNPKPIQMETNAVPQ